MHPKIKYPTLLDTIAFVITLKSTTTTTTTTTNNNNNNNNNNNIIIIIRGVARIFAGGGGRPGHLKAITRPPQGSGGRRPPGR